MPDPYRNFNFVVEIGGIQQAGFSDASGFGASTDPIEYREGGDNTHSHKLPGQTKYPNIVLKWGLTDSHELWDWYKNIVNGIPDRRHGSVILMDEQRKDVLRWSVENMWIKKIEAPTFNATANEVAVESVEIVHEGLALES